jgi:hypothetical protein
VGACAYLNKKLNYCCLFLNRADAYVSV